MNKTMITGKNYGNINRNTSVKMNLLPKNFMKGQVFGLNSVK